MKNKQWLLSVLCLCGWPMLVVADDWPAWQHDLRRSGFTEESLDARELGRLWSWHSPHPPQPAWAGPAKWDAYAGRRGLPSMRSYDTAFQLISANGAIFFGSSVDDSLHCLDAATGRTRWIYTTDGPIRVAPQWVEGRVYFGSDDGYAYCLDAATGKLVWKFRPVEPEQRFINNGRLIPFHPCRTGVLVSDGIAYFACGMLPWKNSWLCAVDAGTGRPEGDGTFVRELSDRTMEGAPALSSKLMFFPQGRVAPQVFNRSDGRDLGQIKKSGGGSLVVVTLDSQVLHGPASKPREGGFRSTNAESLEMVAGYGRGNALVVADRTSWMLTDDELIASDLVDRNVIWKAPSDTPHSLIAANDVLFAGGEDEVAAYSARDGERLWSRMVEGKVFGLAVAGEQLYVSTDAGNVYAFAAGAGPDPVAPPTVSSSESPASPVAVIESVNDARLLDRWVFHAAQIAGKQVRGRTGRPVVKLANAAKITRAGRYEALEFDGSNQSALITADHRTARLPRQSLSAAAWVRIDSPREWGGIVGAIHDNGSDERGWSLGYRNKRFSFAVSTASAGRLTYLTAPTDFETGRWYHVAGTWDGKRMTLYVDGQAAAHSDAQSGEIVDPPRTFYEIGAYHDQDENFRLSGAVHEVRVYSATLSPRDVSDQFNAKVAGFPVPQRGFEVAAGPWLTFTQPGQAEVRWHTAEPSPSVLILQRAGERREFRRPELTTEHLVTLTGLQHRREYSWVIEALDEGETRTTADFELDTFFNYEPLRAAEGESVPKSFSEAADEILKRSGLDRGLCLVLGSGEGLLATALTQRSRLRVVGVDTDAARVDRVRARLLAAGLYGTRVSIHHVESLDDVPFVSRFANLIVSEEILTSGQPPASAPEVARMLRPDGGIALLGGMSRDDVDRVAWSRWTQTDPGSQTTLNQLPGDTPWCRLERGPLPGAGEWTHLYGRADNSAFGGEQLGGATKSDDLEVQWVGRPGPRYQADRNGRKPSPLSVGGRLFLQGLQRIVAADAFNGEILWSLEIPDFERFNMPRDCGNWCADREFVYAAVRDRVWQIDAARGTVTRFFDVAPERPGDFEWGYIARERDKLIGSAVRAHTAYTNFWGGGSAGWYDERSGPVTFKVCSDTLFARNVETGETAWQWTRGLVINPTVTVADGVVYFVECRNPEALNAPARRVEGPELWKDQYLVALDVDSGSIRWERPIDTADGTVVFYMAHAGDRLTIVSSTDSRYHVEALSDLDGESQWKQDFGWLGGKGDHGKAMSRPAIVGDRIYVRPRVLALEDGALMDVTMPGGGCGTYACTENVLFFRAGTVTMWDRKEASASTWKRLRPDCWLSTIPAGGALLSPEGGGGCSCGSWMETSVGFLPRRPDVAGNSHR